MPVISHQDVDREAFRGGAEYQTLVGDDKGSTPIRLGVQTSPPGYRTPVHSHPYMETITILEGQGEAWLEGSDDIVQLKPGVTLVLPPDVRHWFGATGSEPLVTLGVHASGHRIVDVHDDA
ncbi:MAG: cupin domain-containing protein [Pseudomonadota bacterium]